jgi:F-type H+-transporting ATPase subunit epsilon
MMPIRCEIVSQDRIVYQGDADIVLLPGSEGEMGILPNHSPLLTMLRFGVITVRVKGRENVEEIDVQRAEEARQRVEDMLKEGVAPDTDQYMALRAALLRSQLRVKAVERYRRRQRRDIRHNQQDS